MSDPSLEVVELEGSSYRTWPDRMGVVGGKRETQAGRRASLSGLLLTKSSKNLEALEVLRRPTLATALSSLSISYSPKTKGLHDSEAKNRTMPTESQMAKVPTGDAETQSYNDLGSKPSDCDQNFLRSDDSTCDDWNPQCGSEHLDDVVEIGPNEKETKPVELNSNQPAVEGQQLQDDENQGEVLGQQRYVPTHRKAFSLPRTLEVVDELGAISPHPPSTQVESPRSTLLRYGLSYKPYDFTKDQEHQEEDSLSGVSGLTDFSETRDSLGDSGIFSGSSGSVKQNTKKGLSEFLSMGQRLISRSSQQVAKIMRKEGKDALVGAEPEAVSSSGLIMEARPAGLPAKSSEEELRHQRQHQKLVEEARRKEQEDNRERARRAADQRKAEDDLSSLTSYWTNTVLTDWQREWQSKKTQGLWWRGLPPPVRGKVWRLALYNSLNLTTQLYTILRTRAHSANESKEMLQLVSLDVSRTFPQLGIFQEGGPYHSTLRDLLGAYVCYRPDLGYVQGMSFIAAILLLNLDEADAFVVFANLVNRPLLAAFYRVDTTAMSQNYSIFSAHLASHLPRLARHFARAGLRPDLYMVDWVMTLFSKAAPLDITCRIWDLLIRDGEGFLFRAALGVLSLYQDQLLKETDFVLMAQFLTKLPENMDSDALFARIDGIALEHLQSVS